VKLAFLEGLARYCNVEHVVMVTTLLKQIQLHFIMLFYWVTLRGEIIRTPVVVYFMLH